MIIPSMRKLGQLIANEMGAKKPTAKQGIYYHVQEDKCYDVLQYFVALPSFSFLSIPLKSMFLLMAEL